MDIGCTKRLLDQINLKKTQEPSGIDDFFCWSANLVTLNRRKTMVISNISCQLAFVLYGLKAKDWKRMPELIRDGIAECFRQQFVKEEFIAKYLEAAGPMQLTRTKGPKAVARLNRACERAYYFLDTYNDQFIYQAEIVQMINNDLVGTGGSGQYKYITDIFREEIVKFAGPQASLCRAVEMMVKLEMGSRSAWRRIITPMHITFRQLHDVIQDLFNWYDEHLHLFETTDPELGEPLRIICYEDDLYADWSDVKRRMDTGLFIDSFVKVPGKMIYRYDFGDGWTHTITFKKILEDYDKKYPVCIMGEGDAPPEDVGGPGGYGDFLKIMANPSHEEHESMKEWAEFQHYRLFDLEEINRRLKYSLSRWRQ